MHNKHKQNIDAHNTATLQVIIILRLFYSLEAQVYRLSLRSRGAVSSNNMLKVHQLILVGHTSECLSIFAISAVKELPTKTS
jgi:hypothetical protein